MGVPPKLKNIFRGSPKKGPPSGETSKAVVLVVEDDHTLRWMLVRALEGIYEVIEAADGKLALDLLKKVKPPDAIVCDVMMPRLDGIAFVRTLKGIPELSSVPVLFLTARDSAAGRLEGMNLGARHYVTKPFKMADVLAKVEKMISGSTSRLRQSAVIR